jgi:hypothetical protein
MTKFRQLIEHVFYCIDSRHQSKMNNVESENTTQLRNLKVVNLKGNTN